MLQWWEGRVAIRLAMPKNKNLHDFRCREDAPLPAGEASQRPRFSTFGLAKQTAAHFDNRSWKTRGVAEVGGGVVFFLPVPRRVHAHRWVGPGLAPL